MKLPLVLCRNPIERGRSSWWPSATCSAWRWGRRRCLLPGMGCCCYWRFWCTTKSSSCLVNIINVIHNSPWSMPIHVKNFFFVSWTWARVSLFFQLNKRVTPSESIIGSLTWSLETIPGAENRVWIQVRVFIEVAAVWFSFSTGLEEAGGSKAVGSLVDRRMPPGSSQQQ